MFIIFTFCIDIGKSILSFSFVFNHLYFSLCSANRNISPLSLWAKEEEFPVPLIKPIIFLSLLFNA